MTEREDVVRAAFAAQARWCAELGSPFTARLCEIAGERLDRSSAVGRRMLDWRGNPDALHDSVPLRFAGGLHALVRQGRLPELARLYPSVIPGLAEGESPDPLSTDPSERDRTASASPETSAFMGSGLSLRETQNDSGRLWSAVEAAMRDAEAELLPWLDLPPQTNEVARSAVLVGGLAAVVARTGLPLAVYELGCSAGLNLLPDHYDVRLGGRRYGDPTSPVCLRPAWEGGDPPAARVRIVSRRGVDQSPLFVDRETDRARLAAYVWADQTERLARLEAALAIAVRKPPQVDRGDAAEWLDRNLGDHPDRGVTRVVMHSIAFQYFPDTTQAWITARMAEAGSRASRTEPLAWLRYEFDPEAGRPSLRLRIWPHGSDTRLAFADAHARSVTWLV